MNISDFYQSCVSAILAAENDVDCILKPEETQCLEEQTVKGRSHQLSMVINICSHPGYLTSLSILANMNYNSNPSTAVKSIFPK